MDLEPLAEFHVLLDDIVHLGDTQWGRRRLVAITGGSSPGEPVDPDEYYFRLFCRFEAGDPRYQWLNRTMVVASAARAPNAVRYQACALT